MTETATNLPLSVESASIDKSSEISFESLGLHHLCLKRTIVFVNSTFLILGLVMSIISSAASSSTYSGLIGDTVPKGILVLGVFVMMVALIGCMGAKRESRNMLLFYVVVLTIIVICQLGVGISLAVKSDEFPSLVVDGWDGSTNALKVLVQQKLSCCGLKTFNLTAPIVASPQFISGIAGDPCPDVTVQTRVTCFDLIVEAVESSYVLVGVVAVIFAVLEIMGLIFSILLVVRIRNYSFTEEKLQI